MTVMLASLSIFLLLLLLYYKVMKECRYIQRKYVGKHYHRNLSKLYTAFMNLYTSVCQVVRDVVDILDTLLLEWDPEVVEDQGSE